MSEQNWKDSLPEGFTDAPYFKDAESPEQALQSIQDAAAWMGNSLRIPGPDASDEQKAEFMAKAVDRIPGLMPVPDPDNVGDVVYAKIGKPDTPEAYKAPEVEGFEVSPDQLGDLKSYAHENNMTQAQFDALYTRQANLTKAEQENMIKTLQEEQTIIANEWGSAKDERLQEITNFLSNDENTPPELVDAVKGGKVTAAYARWLHGLVSRVAEPGELQGQESGESTLVPSEAKAQLEDLTARLVKMHPADPNYDHLVGKRVELAKQAFPE